MKKSINKARISRGAILVTFLLALFSTCALTVYSRYVSTSSGSMGTNVASFNVSIAVAAGQTTEFNLSDENQSEEYRFSVTSSSKVAVSYDVIVVLPEALPEGVSVTLKNGSTDVDADVDGLVYTFADAGSFTATAGSESLRHDLSLTVAASQFDAEKALTGIEVKVVASQKTA